MNSNLSAISATKPKNRIVSLDILRGVALFGIATVNILGFNASFFDFGGFYASLPDAGQLSFYQMFISLTADKFIFIFSFLFGYGIWMQWDRFNHHQASFNLFFTRRMLILAFFGLLHVSLLWAGDILLPYAVAGMVLLGLRKLPDILLLLLGFFFYFFVIFWLGFSILIPLPDALSSTCSDCIIQAQDVYTYGNYWEVLQLRFIEYVAFLPVNLFYYLPKIIGTLIFGYLASKHRLHNRFLNFGWKWVATTIVVLGLSIVVYIYYETIVLLLLPSDSIYFNMFYMMGYETMNLFVAMAYMLVIMWLASFKWSQLLLVPFSYPGRMSLTNYLLQSLFFGFLFYGWGMGFFGWLNVTQIELFAVFIFVSGMLFSYFWLKEFEQGPLEKVWRKWSYPRK